MFIAASFVKKSFSDVVTEASDVSGWAGSWLTNDRHPVYYKSIARQSADAKAGAFMLVAGFVMQLVGTLGWQPHWFRADLFVPAAIGIDVLALGILHWKLRPWAEKRVMQDAFRFNVRTLRDAQNSEIHGDDSIDDWLRSQLGNWGKAWNCERRAGETNAAYGTRLLGGKTWSEIQVLTDGMQSGSSKGGGAKL